MEATRRVREFIEGATDTRYEDKGQDRYGRTLAKVYVDGQSLDLLMLQAGAAWHFKKYNSEQSLAAAEDKARRITAGLWKVSDNPVAPWDYRDGVRPEPEPAVAVVPLTSAQPPKTETATKPPATKSEPELNHWLTQASGKRHNASCRFYKNSKGRLCTPTEGTACKIYGG